MIQDPNPMDDPVFERFVEWLEKWRNCSGEDHKFRAFLSENDLKRIWIEGMIAWHTFQIGMCPPTEDYHYHQSQMKNLFFELEKIPTFFPKHLMALTNYDS